MTPIERAARALAEELDCTARSGERITSADDLRTAEIDIGVVDLFAIARTILQAIREPSEAMHDAGSSVIENGAAFTHDQPLPTLRNAWKAMIDKALEEGS